MVTPGNVLVPPIWHFILLYHPVPSAFPSPHTGITLIMIIAMMIMITTAKLHSLSLSLIFNTQGIMIDWKAACKCFPRPIFSAAFNLFVSSVFLIYLAFFILSLLSALIAHSLSSLPLVSFQSFSILWQSFISVVVLLSTFPGPSYLRHLSPALSFSQSWFSATFFYSSPTLLLSCLLILLQQRNKIN